MTQRQHPPTFALQRDLVSVRQARRLARLMLALEREAVAQLGDLSRCRERDFTSLPAYDAYLTGAVACGFVMDDATPDNPLHTGGRVADLDLAGVRQFVHSLDRAERWNVGFCSPILSATASGWLHEIAQRLLQDGGLRAQMADRIEPARRAKKSAQRRLF